MKDTVRNKGIKEKLQLFCLKVKIKFNQIKWDDNVKRIQVTKQPLNAR